MSAWADLAGDDSNLSMAADEFVGLKVLGDISNSASQNRSRFDPELDNSKQGLNRQLKLFGLGNNDSNSNLSKKRRHSELQTEADDADMPPKSKQRISEPSQNNFSRFLEPSVPSAPDLSSLSSSSTNASGTTGPFGSVSTPGTTDNTKTKETWYSAVLGKNKGKSGKKKKTPQSSDVPALLSTSTTTNPTPKSTGKTVKIARSIPSSVRRKRMMQRRKKSASSPRKFAEPSSNAEIGDPPGQKENEADDEREIEMEDVAKENITPPEAPRQQFERMDEDGGDTREALENGLKVLKTETQGRIYVPLDILQSAEKRAEQPRPTPFRLTRAKSSEKCGSMSPTKLSFSEPTSPPQPTNPVDSSSALSPPTTFDMFTFMPNAISAASFGLTTSTSISNSGTPNNENADGQEEKVDLKPAFLPFGPPFLPMAGLQLPSPGVDGSAAVAGFNSTLSPVFFNFMPLSSPLPMTAQISNASSTDTLTSPPAFVPFMIPTVVQPLVTVPPPTTTASTTPVTQVAPEEVAQEITIDVVESSDVLNVEEDKEEVQVESVTIPATSVWAPAQPSEEKDADAEPTWAKKCFRREVARNRVLKLKEEQMKVERKKLEMKFKIREKQLLPIEPERHVHRECNPSYGSDNKGNWRRRREYHPYARDSKRNDDDFEADRRMRGRARTRSLSVGVESPSAHKLVYRRKESASESGTSVTSPSQGRSVSVSEEARDLPYQEPQPVTAEKIAWRLNQIEMAKNTTGYQNFIAQIPKCQRKKKHPSTPNPKEKISKRRWVGKFNKWRKALHEYDNEDEKPNSAEAMDVDEEETLKTGSCDSVPPTPADVEKTPSAPEEGQQ